MKINEINNCGRSMNGLGPSPRTLCPLMEENIFPTIGVVNTILQLTAKNNCHRNANQTVGTL